MKKILYNEVIRRLDYPTEQSAYAQANSYGTIDIGFRNLMSDIIKSDEKRRDAFKTQNKKK